MRIAHRVASITAFALIGSVGLVAIPAYADSDQDIADIAADAAPGSAAPMSLRDFGSSMVGELGDGATVMLPDSGAEPLVTTVPGHSDDSAEMAVSLPRELRLGDGEPVGDGVVYRGLDGGTSVVAQALDSSQVRVQVVIPDASAEHRSTYSFGEGYEVVLTEGGGAIAFDREDPETPIVTVEAPWAVDAVGNDVRTWYEVDGSDLVQVVDSSSALEYPVVADPTYSVGWGYYAHFNHAETRTIADGGWAVTGGSGTVCAVVGAGIGGPVGAAALAAACFVIGGIIVYEAGVAKNSSPERCLYLRYTVGANLTPLFIAGTYNDSRCR